MQEVMILVSLISPAVLGLVELAKITVKFPKNYIPLVAFIIGLLVGAAAYPFTDLDTTLRLWAGGFAGLSATGLFEAIKKREGNTKDKKDDTPYEF